MDKIDKRYENGKIYTIKCKYDDTLIYVGSTICSLCERMRQHRKDKTTSLYKYVNGDWNNWYIELYEEYPCNNKTILEKREGEIIKLIGTINKRIAGRTIKEYYNDNVDKLLEQKKQYYKENVDKINEYKKQYIQNNKEKIAEYNKEYRQNNIDKVKEQKKQYYKDNADKIKEKKKEKVECDKCKSFVNYSVLARHKKTKKCLNYNVANN